MADGDGKKKRNKQPTDLHDEAAKLGHRGGLKGGPARARKLTPERRREIGRLGAEARWKGKKPAAKKKKGSE